MFKNLSLLTSGIVLLSLFVPAMAQANCQIPLPEMTTGQTCKGWSGGLYGNWSNTVPASHLQQAMAASQQIGPNPVMLSIGFSNVQQEFDMFIAREQNNTPVRLVNGAVPGQITGKWASIDMGVHPWSAAEKEVKKAGYDPSEVEVIWMKVANFANDNGYVETLQRNIAEIAVKLGDQSANNPFKNVKLLYVSGRIYAGHAPASNQLNPEPYAHESGFAVQLAINDQIQGNVTVNNKAFNYANAPVVLWGPYIWDPTWPASYFESDKIHPAEPAEIAVSDMLFDFFSTDQTSQPWFTSNQPPVTTFPTNTPIPATPTPTEPGTGGPSPSPTPTNTPLPPLLGDFDLDGDVDQGDYQDFLPFFSTTDVAHDLNSDGIGDIFDLNILISNFGKSQ